MSQFYHKIKENTNRVQDDYKCRVLDRFNTTIPIVNQYLEHNSKVHKENYMNVNVRGLWGEWLSSLTEEDKKDVMRMYQAYYTKEGFKISNNTDSLTFTIYWE